MNAGAATSEGDVLLFLHADTELPDAAADSVCAALEQHEWGRFDVRLSGRHPMFRVIERLISWRSRWSGMATGDQALFVRRTVFERVGGFPEIPLMEDLALSKRLLRRGRPGCLRGPRGTVTTSSRRWEAVSYTHLRAHET